VIGFESSGIVLTNWGRAGIDDLRWTVVSLFALCSSSNGDLELLLLCRDDERRRGSGAETIGTRSEKGAFERVVKGEVDGRDRDRNVRGLA